MSHSENLFHITKRTEKRKPFTFFLLGQQFSKMADAHGNMEVPESSSRLSYYKSLLLLDDFEHFSLNDYIYIETYDKTRQNKRF